MIYFILTPPCINDHFSLFFLQLQYFLSLIHPSFAENRLSRLWGERTVCPDIFSDPADLCSAWHLLTDRSCQQYPPDRFRHPKLPCSLRPVRLTGHSLPCSFYPDAVNCRIIKNILHRPLFPLPSCGIPDLLAKDGLASAFAYA